MDPGRRDARLAGDRTMRAGSRIRWRRGALAGTVTCLAEKAPRRSELGAVGVDTQHEQTHRRVGDEGVDLRPVATQHTDHLGVAQVVTLQPNDLGGRPTKHAEALEVPSRVTRASWLVRACAQTSSSVAPGRNARRTCCDAGNSGSNSRRSDSDRFSSSRSEQPVMPPDPLRRGARASRPMQDTRERRRA